MLLLLLYILCYTTAVHPRSQARNNCFLGVQDLQMATQDDTLILKGNVHLYMYMCQDAECYWEDTIRRNVGGIN